MVRLHVTVDSMNRWSCIVIDSFLCTTLSINPSCLALTKLTRRLSWLQLPDLVETPELLRYTPFHMITLKFQVSC